MTLRSLLLCSIVLPSVLEGAAFAQATVTLPTTRNQDRDNVADRGEQTPVETSDPVVVTLPGQEVEPDSEPEVQDDSTTISGVPIGEHGRPDINPYDRDIDMTVPLTFQSDSLGEIPIRMTADDRLLLGTTEFLNLVRAILNEAAHAELSGQLVGMDQFETEDLAGSGVGLTYDPSTLAVVVIEVDAEKRAVRDLFAPPRDDLTEGALQPANFSGYMNLNVSQTHIWEDDKVRPPTVTFDGAVRVGRFVFEGDARFRERSELEGDTYAFERNYARLVYDEPERYRRWLLGDLDPETRGQQSFVSMGGIGVLRQRRRFNAFRPAVLQANRELIIQRQSTVRFLRNGTLYRELRLDPGRYDYSSLPLIAGSNEIDIQVIDDTGAVQNLGYQQYLDPIDLDPGDYEYGAYVGPTSRIIFGAPDYSGPIAFTGFFRKAFFDRPAIGIGLQASQDVQTLTGQTQFVLPNGGRLLIDGGVSNSKFAGQGFAGGASYEHYFDRAGLTDSLTVRTDYISDQFATLSNREAFNSTAYTISAQYTRQINLRLSSTTTGSYIKSRGDIGDSYRLGTTAYYRLNRKWSLRAGAEYAKYPNRFSRGDGVNFSIGLVFQPDYRRRAEARYESRNNLAELSYNQSGLNNLNSVGFGGIVSRQEGQALAQGYAYYAANRFEISASHASFGPSLSDFTAVNATSARIGTTLAFADGIFGVGRRINDSFMLLHPHENLDGRSVVAGQSLAQNDYIAKSGALGAAVNNFLGSYANQTVQYDVENPPSGYDIGPGVFRVHPPYKSGYAARIGTVAFASAMGTLVLSPDNPISLVGGRVTLQDVGEDDNPQPLPFFTNSVGRFAISGLVPGRRYLIETYGKNGAIGYRIEFTVPEATTGLYNLGEVRPGGSGAAAGDMNSTGPSSTNDETDPTPEEAKPSADRTAFDDRSTSQDQIARFSDIFALQHRDPRPVVIATLADYKSSGTKCGQADPA